MKVKTLKISEDLHKALKVLSSEKGITIQEYVQSALMAKVSQAQNKIKQKGI